MLLRHSADEVTLPRRTTLDSCAQVVVAATASIGVLVAWASAIPTAVRSELLFLGVFGWTIGITFGTIKLAKRACSRSMRWCDWIPTVLGVVGISVAALSAAQLEVIRVAYGRPGLVYNVDWRWAWNHAQAIARFGGLDRALDYAGAPLDYHVGSAWLAAATERTLGGGMTEVLFGLVPMLCVMSTATAALLLLSQSGVPQRLAAAAVGVAFCLPWGIWPVRLGRGLPDILLDADTWFFASGLMLNSFLAVAVGLCSLALLLDQRRRPLSVTLGALGLASLAQIKPHFFVSLGAVAGVVGFGRSVGCQPFNPRSWTVLLASGGALALALLEKWVLPGNLPGFSSPTWAPGQTGIRLGMFATELVMAPSVLAALALLTLLVAGARGLHAPVSRRPGELLAAVMLTLALLLIALTLVSLPLRPDIVVRANALGFTFSETSAQSNLWSGLVPLRLLLAVSALGVLAVFLRRDRMPACAMPAALLAGLIIVSPLLRIAHDFAKPSQGYEAAEDTGLLTLLRQVPRNSELLIASDLVDPAEDYKRRSRGALLTAYGGHAFYVSNLKDYHYTRSDAVERLTAILAFFGSPWSGWHSAWLAHTHITHVLVSDRCLPRWWGDRDTPLHVVGRSGAWTLLEPRGLTLKGDSFPVSWETMNARYGRAPCL